MASQFTVVLAAYGCTAQNKLVTRKAGAATIGHAVAAFMLDYLECGPLPSALHPKAGQIRDAAGKRIATVSTDGIVTPAPVRKAK